MTSLGFLEESGDKNKISKTDTNDDYEYISINQCFMWVSNAGDGSHDPTNDGSGFYWPGGINATITAIFEDGLLFGGKIGSEIRVNGNTHRQGLQAGKILSTGTPDDPSLEKYRVYKIRKNWEDLPEGPDKDDYETDYNEWPVEDGAPWVDIDGDGIWTPGIDEPEFVGDEVLWYVANDMDAARSTFTYGTLPMGLEFQTTVFAFNRTGDLGDIVFKNYLIINKGTNTIEEMYLALWSDTDLGEANDDATGSDTTLSLGYTWNGDNDDENYYGPNPPAIGYDFFQGPIVPGDPDDRAKFKGEWREGFKNLPMTAFAFYMNPDDVYADPSQGDAEGSIEMYNYMLGNVWDGSPFIDPNTGQETKFVLTGDPETRTGWYFTEGWPGGPAPQDVRHVMSSGPFTMAPGDTQEVVIGIIIGRGSSNVKSVKELKIKDQAAQFAYDADFQLPPSPPAPQTSFHEQDSKVTFYWDTNSETYDNDFYQFEGYRVWQFRDLAGSDPRLMETYDLDNEIGVIYGFVLVNGERILAPVIQGTNSGLIRDLSVTTSKYTNTALLNANPYYYAITAYGVAKNDQIIPSYLESVPQIIEVFPGTPAIDQDIPTEPEDILPVTQTEGAGDGSVLVEVVDPVALSGDTYAVTFDSLVVDETTGEKELVYSVTNTATNQIIIDMADDFGGSTVGREIYDGFKIAVQDQATDSIAAAGGKYRVQDIIEVGTGQSVHENTSATGNWQIEAGSLSGRFAFDGIKAVDEGLGYNYYELRFTTESEFYLTGYGFGAGLGRIILKDDPKAPGTIPFEVWNLGEDLESTDDDVRLVTKIYDFARSGAINDSTKAIDDSMWTQLDDGTWEQIFVFETDVYPADDLPDMSGRTETIDYRVSHIVVNGDLPAEGTVIRFSTYKPLTTEDVYEFVTLEAVTDNTQAKSNLDKITVFPNPYFGSNNLELNKYQRFMRFTGLPTVTTIRIFTLSGTYVTRIDKDDTNQYVDWNLLNEDNLPVSSGIYIAYLEMPDVGTKVMKLAIIQEQQILDRL
jgi:hypothetical protein